MSWHQTMHKTTKTTIELGELVENGFDIWNFDYDSFYQGDEKKTFEQKVIDHYYFRQIGQETPARFRHYFKTRIREIMPYYKQLYESVKIMENLDDPFGNVDITETFEQESTGESSDTNTSTTSSNTSSDHRFSNTPQGSISNIDNYLTEASKDSSNMDASVEGSGSGSSRGTVRHTLTRKGNQGVNTYAHDMKELRETFINIDMMIINELNDLFLGIY